MTARARIALLVLVIAVTAVAAQSASAATFKASIRGTQYLNWSVSGTTDSCEVRRGEGAGEVRFSFKSSSSSTLFVSSARKAPNMVGSIPSKATGTISGSFTDSLATACPGFEPKPTYTDPTDGCGTNDFGLRVDLKTRGAFVHVTGPGQLKSTGECPFAFDKLLSTDLSACGDGVNLWQRSWGISSYHGQGLFASKLHISSKSLLRTRKGKRKVITGRAIVSCSQPSNFYSGPVTMNGELKYSLTLKRTG